MNRISSLLICTFLLISCEDKNEKRINFKNFEINLSKNEEPPLILELKSGNEIQYFVENQPKKWRGVTKDSETIIGVYDWKLFPHNNIEFEYPRTYKFEANLSASEDIWTLSGNDLTIMVINTIVELNLKEYVDSMINQFGKSNCLTKEITKTLNNYKLKGIKLSVTLAGINLELDVLEIIHKSGKKSLLVFQNTLTDSNEKSEESFKTMNKVKQTFKIH